MSRTGSIATNLTNASHASAAVALVSTRNNRKVYRVRGTNFEIDDRYSVTSVVGHGAYGVVCSALDDVSGKEVAIKRIGRVFDDLIDGRRMWREVRILRLLKESKCRNVLKLHRLLHPKDSVTAYRDLYVVTDLLEVDMFSLIRMKKEVSVSSLKNIAAQVLRCLADMHSMGIIHRDIKPSNILLNECEEVSVCDFGLARGGLHTFTEAMDMTDYVVTRWYRPPELLSMSKYHVPVDVWAVGCVMAEYTLQRPLFPGRDYLHQLFLVLSSVAVTSTEFITNKASIPFITDLANSSKDSRPLGKLLAKLPSEGVDVISKMLQFDPMVRITARDALAHPFFAQVGGDGQQEPPQPPQVDWSFDMPCEVSEAQLRAAIWAEMEASQTDSN